MGQEENYVVKRRKVVVKSVKTVITQKRDADSVPFLNMLYSIVL